jgi:DnaJ-class molecular chaperone
MTERKVQCPFCGGSGRELSGLSCHACFGKGEISAKDLSDLEAIEMEADWGEDEDRQYDLMDYEF